MHAMKGLLGAALLASVLLAATAALGAGAPMTSGTVQFWVTPSQTGSGGQVLITGAIADYGKSQNVTAAGKPVSKKGPYKNLMLKKGTILLDLKNYETAMNNANPTMYNRSTCSAYLTVSAPVQLLSGTGAYKGITGTVTLHAENAALLPRTKNGACNGNGNPVRSYITISGSGTVKLG